MPGHSARRLAGHRAPQLDRPTPVTADPPTPLYYVATLIEAGPFPAVNTGVCENPYCSAGRVIRPGQATLRDIDGGYFHDVCARRTRLMRPTLVSTATNRPLRPAS